jgi:hypothetical protein
MTAYAWVNPPATPPTSPARATFPGASDKVAFSACRELTNRIAPLVDASKTAYMSTGSGNDSRQHPPREINPDNNLKVLRAGKFSKTRPAMSLLGALQDAS